MAKKKVRKKRPAKKNVRRKPASVSKVMPRKKVVCHKILTFLILFAISVVFYYVTSPGALNDIFYFAMIVFGALVLAFVIIGLIIFFLKILKRK